LLTEKTIEEKEKTIEEKEKIIGENRRQLVTAILDLSSAGMNAEKLAAVFRRSEAEIKEILNQAKSGN
jgi:hypothetical protein